MRAAQTAQTSGIAYTRREDFARYVFTTDATSIELISLQDTSSIPGGFNSTGLLIDGVDQGSGNQLGTTMGAYLSTTFPISGGGTHTLQLVDGPCFARGNGASYNVGCTPNTSFRLTRGATMNVVAPSAPTKRILVISDSIMVGAIVASGAGPYQAPSILMRKNALVSVSGAFAGAHVTVAGVAGGRLFDLAIDAPAVASTVANWSAQLDGSSANKVLFTLGTNDYGSNMLAATWQTELETLLDAFHVAKPAALVDLYGPITRQAPAAETANGAGSTLANFRTAMSTVAAARSSWVTYRSGAGVVSGGNYAPDGVHPNAAGMIQLEADQRIQVGY